VVIETGGGDLDFVVRDTLSSEYRFSFSKFEFDKFWCWVWNCGAGLAGVWDRRRETG
jgi:hypothetical protein